MAVVMVADGGGWRRWWLWQWRWRLSTMVPMAAMVEGHHPADDGIIIKMVIFKATHWLRFWAQLQRYEDDGEFLKVACRKLELIVMQLFANYGWRFTNRLQ
uniref:Uncharacterized protein n=1 Tax=Oryza sativa subsp. japonica TaxID=39947 RepID=H2KW79_ORYSJ|nr:hypothetical protein LOC_Os11g29274 [Oryza sativa Japonica Group]